jgi:hypothetical protein
VTGLRSSSDVRNIRWLLPVSRSATEQHVLRWKGGYDRETYGRKSRSLPCFSVGLLWQERLQVSTGSDMFYLGYESAMTFMTKKNFHHKTDKWCEFFWTEAEIRAQMKRTKIFAVKDSIENDIIILMRISLACNIVSTGKCLSTFRRSMLPPTSSYFLLSLLSPEDEGMSLLWNVSNYLPVNTA